MCIDPWPTTNRNTQAEVDAILDEKPSLFERLKASLKRIFAFFKQS